MINKLYGYITNYKVVLFAVVIILFIPAIGIKFSWIDDGDNIITISKFIDSIRSWDYKTVFNLTLETTNGRFRPAYWLSEVVMYAFGGNNPALNYVFHFLIVFLTSVFISKIVRLITGSKTVGLFAGLLYLVNPINTENWYRLGPQEPFLGLFLTVSLYFLIKKQYLGVSLLLLFFTIFTKENAFAFLPGIMFLFILQKLYLKKKNNDYLKYIIIGVVFTVILLLITTSIRTGYSQNYSFQLYDIVHKFFGYNKKILFGFGPFVLFAIVSFITRSFFLFKTKKEFIKNEKYHFELAFGIMYLAYILIQTPWIFFSERYLLPAVICMIIFISVEFGASSKYLSNKINRGSINKIQFALFTVFIFYFLTNILNSFNYGNKTAYATTNLQKMVMFLASNTPGNGTVLLNFAKGDATIELVIEIGIHLSLFYDRSDIKVGYLDLDNMPTGKYVVVSGTQAPFRYKEADLNVKLKNTKITAINSSVSYVSSLLPITNIHLNDYWNIYEN